jgi:hypothetical protein
MHSPTVLIALPCTTKQFADQLLSGFNLPARARVGEDARPVLTDDRVVMKCQAEIVLELALVEALDQWAPCTSSSGRLAGASRHSCSGSTSAEATTISLMPSSRAMTDFLRGEKSVISR